MGRGADPATSHPERTLLKVAELVRGYRPHLLVLEDPHGPGSRRCARVTSLLHDLKTYARQSKLPCVQVSRDAVRKRFRKNGTTKHAIANAVGEIFPELVPRLPPLRKPWMSEDERMGIFDAVSFALTALSLRDRTLRRSAAP